MKVSVLRDPFRNAAAAPNGSIYLHTGLWFGVQIRDADRVTLYDAARQVEYVAVYALQGRELRQPEPPVDPLNPQQRVEIVRLFEALPDRSQ